MKRHFWADYIFKTVNFPKSDSSSLAGFYIFFQIRIYKFLKSFHANATPITIIRTSWLNHHGWQMFAITSHGLPRTRSPIPVNGPTVRYPQNEPNTRNVYLCPCQFSILLFCQNLLPWGLLGTPGLTDTHKSVIHTLQHTAVRHNDPINGWNVAGQHMQSVSHTKPSNQLVVRSCSQGGLAEPAACLPCHPGTQPYHLQSKIIQEVARSQGFLEDVISD